VGPRSPGESAATGSEAEHHYGTKEREGGEDIGISEYKECCEAEGAAD
jgi:hypothetical protein